MRDWQGFERRDDPFPHWVHAAFLSAAEVHTLNAEWPDVSDPRWHHERRGYALKSALMFPRRLPDAAQAIAADLYAPASVEQLCALTALPLQPDPWFTEGPLMPRVGGGLHEIHRGGLLKLHLDFSAHPTGLVRALNFLIYLNPDWRDDWRGALLLGNGEACIYPRAGTAVIFETTDTSWHGHPDPLACPPERTRRSLALYYYRQGKSSERQTTVYAA